jgi:DNA ligase (NAD+)
MAGYIGLVEEAEATRPQPTNEYLRSVHFVAYQVLEPSTMTRQQQFTWLTAQGFKTPWTISQHMNDVTEDGLFKILEARKAESAYPLDGIVIGTNTIPGTAGGGEAKNPNDAVAFKAALDEQREETTVVAIEWNLSRQGNWIPRVQIEPVSIGGANIQWVSGHNAAAVAQDAIGPGAHIILRRSGDVIPTIEKVLSPAPGGASMPVAGSWEWDATRVHAKRTEGSTEGTQEALVQALLHALQTLEVDGVGPGLVKKMVAGGFTTMKALWAATPTALAPSLGPTRSVQIHAGLREKHAAATHITLLIASNLLPRGVGRTRLRPLEALCPDPRLWKRENLGHVAGWSSETLDALFASLPAALDWCERSFGPAAAAPVTVAARATTLTKPVGVAVFTGVRDKALEAAMTAAGWEIAPSVTNTTTVLIIADDDAKPSTKIAAAKKKGIEICKLSDFRSRV